MASPDENDDHRLLLLSKVQIQSRRSSGNYDLGSNTDDYENDDDDACWEGVESRTSDEAEEGIAIDEEKDYVEQQLNITPIDSNVGSITQSTTNNSSNAKPANCSTPIHRYVPASTLSLLSSISSTGGGGGLLSDPTLSNSTCHSLNSTDERGNSSTISPANASTVASSATTFRHHHFRTAYRKQQQQQQVSPNGPKSKAHATILTSTSSSSTKVVSIGEACKQNHVSFDHHDRQSALPENEQDDDSAQNENDEEISEDDEVTVLYNDGATPLFKAIEEEDWKQVERICREDAKQASIWVISTGTVQTTFNWSLWKRLPLHEMCRRHPPAATVFRLIEAYPDACRSVTQFGELPLHLAIECGASAAVVTTLISAHWRGVFHQDQVGRTPVDVLRDTEPLLDLLEHQSIQTAFDLSTRTYNEIQTEHLSEITTLQKQHDVGLQAVRAQHDNDLALEQEQQDKLLQQVVDLQAVIQQLNATVADHQRVTNEHSLAKQQLEVEYRNLQVEKNEYKRRLLQSYEQNDNLTESLNQRNAELKDANAKILELQNTIQDIVQYQTFVMQKESALTSLKLQQAFEQYTTMTNAINNHASNLHTLVHKLGIPPLKTSGKPSVAPQAAELDSTIHTIEDSIFGDVLDDNSTTNYRQTKHSSHSHHQRRHQRRLDRLKKQGEEKKHDGDEDDDSLPREDIDELDEAVGNTDEDGSSLVLQETAKAAERAMKVTGASTTDNNIESSNQSSVNVAAPEKPFSLNSDRAASSSRAIASSIYSNNRPTDSIAQSSSVISAPAFRESRHRVSEVSPTINNSISQQKSHINLQAQQQSPRRFSRHYRSLSAASSKASAYSVFQPAVGTTPTGSTSNIKER